MLPRTRRRSARTALCCWEEHTEVLMRLGAGFRAGGGHCWRNRHGLAFELAASRTLAYGEIKWFSLWANYAQLEEWLADDVLTLTHISGRQGAQDGVAAR